MNSKNPKKWEELLNDSDFESRIIRKTTTRVQKQKRSRNIAVSVALVFLVFVTLSINQWIIEPNEIVNNMGYLVEELSSESIVSLSFD
ncbi:MAG: hypothetical protein ACO1NV_09915 [Leptospira bouyouniensis]|uniref:Uncharacterized protein n=1 Tax=Leptospira bouyouniensis TaxID=2484911 RepID=A0A7I0IVP2_9LEPT|nr:hypothetical protein [Leptospira bouyouniensis]TGK49649.1 hypothetical protein EHQ10_07280 [Leptospira bouyouniensis]TGL09366.1 hypothetical protein EHQ43_00345 [Leptospira bouyouniensis]TGM77834.1 hypothetical protein EHQ99_15955 [Leptospira bouyouniensis]